MSLNLSAQYTTDDALTRLGEIDLQTPQSTGRLRKHVADIYGCSKYVLLLDVIMH